MPGNGARPAPALMDTAPTNATRSPLPAATPRRRALVRSAGAVTEGERRRAGQ